MRKIWITIEEAERQISTWYEDRLTYGEVSSADLFAATMKALGSVKRSNTSDTRLYRIWNGMKTRCLNPRCHQYGYYGGRGISVDVSWAQDFKAFRKWALENGYDDTLTLDRIDSNGNYGPGNCRWATRKQQQWNTRKRRNGGSRYKGVSRCHRSGSRWKATINVSGNRNYLGVFPDEESAARAYDAAATKLLGPFARLNFPAESSE